jgi:hypothetical protein
MNLFEQQSLMYGYGTQTTSLSGAVTKNNPTASVAGMPTTTINLLGQKSVMKPTENLTGYPVFHTGGGDLFSNLDKTALLEEEDGLISLYPSGNITLWPTIWTQTDTRGQISNLFLIPGDAPAGSIAFEGGFPTWNSDYGGPESILGPDAAKAPMRSQTPKTATAASGDAEANAYNDLNKRRRRNTVSSFLRTTVGSLFED